MPFRAGQKLRAADLGQQTTCAQYSGSSIQTIGNGADTVVAFSAADVATDHLTRATSGAGHSFTFNTSGIWTVSCCVRWSTTGASATGEKSLHLEDSLGLWHVSQSLGGETDAPVTCFVSVTKYLAAGDFVIAEVFQNSGGSEDLDYNAFFGTPRINFALLLAS
jgi:hypothetical protein